VALLEATSEPDALERYRREDTPAYDVLPAWVATMQPRERVGRCACGRPYPVRAEGVQQSYCSGRCRYRAYYHRTGKEVKRRKSS
jgi:hypothetical protein